MRNILANLTRLGDDLMSGRVEARLMAMQLNAEARVSRRLREQDFCAMEQAVADLGAINRRHRDALLEPVPTVNRIWQDLQETLTHQIRRTDRAILDLQRDDPRHRRAVSIHEAAHGTVATVLLGPGSVLALELYAPGESLDLLGTCTLTARPADRRKELIWRAAGTAADTIIFALGLPYWPDNDLAGARCRIPGIREDEWQDAINDATAILRNHPHALQVIAGALYQQGELDGPAFQRLWRANAWA